MADHDLAVLRQLLSPLSDGVIAVADGQVVAVNDAALSALAPERDRASVRGEPVGVLLDAAEVPAPGERVEVAGAADRRIYEAKGSTGGDLPGVDRLVVLRDVTERARQVRRLRALTRVLRHALRDEMTGVLGRAEYVRDSIEEAGVLSQALDAADAVVDATRELADLGETAWVVEDIFGDEEPESVEVDLAAVVESVVEDAAADHPSVKFDTDLPGRAPAAAPGTIETALAELVENACIHTDAPVPRVDVAVALDGDDVVIEVADNGSGMPSSAREVLERGDQPPLQSDSGLGLWLAHWVVAAAGGEVRVGENVPRGTVVTVEVPAAGA